MKPTQEQVTEWSTEAGLYASRQTDDKFDWKIIYAQQFATIAYEAGRKDENEACAKVCEHFLSSKENDDAWTITRDLAFQAAANVIRARREQ